MDLRSGLAQIAAEHRLDAAAMRRLEAIAGLDGEPKTLATWLPRVVAGGPLDRGRLHVAAATHATS